VKGVLQGTCLQVRQSELSIQHCHQVLWVFEITQGAN